MSVVVRTVERRDHRDLGGVLGRAFADDPIWVWIYPERNRTRRITRMFRAFLRATQDRGATLLTDEARRGAAIWQRSEAQTLGFVGTLRMSAAMIAGGARMRRGWAMLRELESRHPKEPHWYLAALGTDPADQGRGVGSALLHDVLDDPANAGEAAYLETETEANVSFYRRHGFYVIDEFDVPGGGPHLWLMWREPTEPR